MKLLNTILIILVSTSVFCQDDFSDKEKTDFVEMYFSAKTEFRKAEANIKNSHTQHQVDPSRVKEIVTKSLFGKPLNLTNDEREYLEQLASAKEKYDLEKMNHTKNSVHRDLTMNRYNMILKKYKTDIKFQRSLKPFFDHYIQAKS